MKFTVIIPARYASSRLPGKPLADIGGKPMVVRVCEQAAKSGAAAVHVATDDERIVAVVRAAGYSALLTRREHASGTDRIAEAARELCLAGGEIVVNLQGDEPLMEPGLIGEVAAALELDPEAAVATACHPLRDEASLSNPNVVNVVLDSRNRALYFSRAHLAPSRVRRHVVPSCRPVRLPGAFPSKIVVARASAARANGGARAAARALAWLPHRGCHQ